MKAIIEIVIEEIGKDNIFIEEKDIAHGKSVCLKCKNKDKVVVRHYGKIIQ